MIIQVESPIEAFFSIGLMVLAADRKLSRQECSSIFDSMMSLDIFEGDAGQQARRFLGKMLGASEDYVVHKSGVSHGDDLVLSEDMVNELIAAANTMLSPTLREVALAWAIDLAGADGLEERERAMLHRLAGELEVDYEQKDFI